MEHTKRWPLVDYQKSVKVLDFFCGCGGTSVGLQAAGMEIALGLDSDPDAGETFQRYFPEAAFLGMDIQSLSAKILDPIVDKCIGHPLLFSACAPCQPFSRLRKGTNTQDERLGLLNHLPEFVERYRPELLFIENVSGARASNGVFKPFIERLAKLKYLSSCSVVHAHDYGVPQRRARLVLLASRIDSIGFPDRTYAPDAGISYVTVDQSIKDLPRIAAGETCSDPKIHNHRAAALYPINLKRIKASIPGGRWRDWPPALQLDCHKSNAVGFSDVYGRLRGDDPAPTLTTKCISYSNGRFGHPDQSQGRAISVREAARLQTFPDDFVFTGTLGSQARQVGNAVPVLLARRFGEGLVAHARRAADEPEQLCKQSPTQKRPAKPAVPPEHG